MGHLVGSNDNVRYPSIARMFRSPIDRGSPRPIFIVGSPRSGTSILTWCVGQHPNIFPSPESDWIGQFATEVGAAYKLGVRRERYGQLSFFGITEPVFFRAFGDAIGRLLREHKRNFWRKDGDVMLFPPAGYDPQQLVASYGKPKSRWIDGTPEYSYFIPGLRKLFPEVRFIHIIRDVESVVESLIHFHKIAPEMRFTRREAYQTWINTVRACLRAEEAYGSQMVVRVRYRHLVEDPASALRRVLEGIGENMADCCTEPLATRVNSSPREGELPEGEPVPEDLVEEARRLSDELMSGDYPTFAPKLAMIDELEKDLHRRIDERLAMPKRILDANRLAEKRFADLQERSQWALKLDAQLKAAKARIAQLEGANGSAPPAEVAGFDEQIRNLRSELDSRTRELAEAKEQVAERTAWSLARDRDVEERDRLITELRRVSEERTAWALARDEEVERLGKRVVELQDELESRTKWALDLDRDVKVKDNLILELQRQRDQAIERNAKLEETIAQIDSSRS